MRASILEETKAMRQFGFSMRVLMTSSTPLDGWLSLWMVEHPAVPAVRLAWDGADGIALLIGSVNEETMAMLWMLPLAVVPLAEMAA